MHQLPVLLGNQLIFQPSWEAPPPQLIITAQEIREYKKMPFSPSLPTYEIGQLGQVVQRQLNFRTVPYKFRWELMLNDFKKEQLEGFVAVQAHRYNQNNNRSDVSIIYDDERWATLELLEHARKVRIAGNRFDLTPTANSHWQFSRFNIKIESITQERLNADLWIVLLDAVESNLDLEDISP